MKEFESILVAAEGNGALFKEDCESVRYESINLNINARRCHINEYLVDDKWAELDQDTRDKLKQTDCIYFDRFGNAFTRIS
jgi:hypothetical protein